MRPVTHQVRLENAAARRLAAISTTAGTPSGEAATVAHFGEYSQMDAAYKALERWCAD